MLDISSVQESIKDEVAGRSRYAGGSFAFGDGSFPEVTAFLEKGSEELLWVSHIIPLACVMHEGKVGPAPVIIDVREEEGFLMQSKQVEVWKSFQGHLGAPPQLL